MIELKGELSLEVLNQTQQVLDLLEDDIMNVDYNKISKLTGIPLGLYQRIFTYVCNVSLVAYVRKRRLTLSAALLLSKNISITEVALEFGYESNSAFSRAFKELFTVPPALITQGIYDTKAYPPLSFVNDDTYYVLKGKRMMVELVKLEYVDTEDMLLIGISNKEYRVTTKDLWKVFWESGFDKKLFELKEYQIGMDDCIGLGYMTDFETDAGLGDAYIVGKYFKIGTPVPEHMTGRIVKGGTIVKAQIKGKNLDDIISNAYILISHMVQINGYTLAYESFYWLEFYTISRFCDPLECGVEEIVLDWYMPCKKTP